MSPARIGVIGGGLAGMAAALAAADGGAEVVLFERRPVLGGLTSSIRHNGLCFGQWAARVPSLLHCLPGLSRPHRGGRPGVPAGAARRAGARAGRLARPRSSARPCLPRCTWRGHSEGTVTSPCANECGWHVLRSRSGGSTRRRVTRQRLVRRLAHRPWPEPAGSRPPLEPDRVADAQCPSGGCIARARGEGLPGRPSRPVRRRRHRVVRSPARRASRSQRRTSDGSCGRPKRCLQPGQHDRSLVPRSLQRQLRFQERGRRRRDRGYAATCVGEDRRVIDRSSSPERRSASGPLPSSMSIWSSTGR